MNWGFRKCLSPHREEIVPVPASRYQWRKEINPQFKRLAFFDLGTFSSVHFFSNCILVPRLLGFDCFRVAFLWIPTQQVWSLRSLWTCDLKNKRDAAEQRSVRLYFPGFCCLFWDIFPALALRPYVSTGSEAGPRCPASDRTAALLSLPPDLWTRWSKAERGPQRPWTCSPGPAATCAPAQTRLRNQDKLGSEAGWTNQKHWAEHLTLRVCFGKHFLEVLLLNFWKTFDVVSRLQMKQNIFHWQQSTDFFLFFSWCFFFFNNSRPQIPVWQQILELVFL